MGRYRRTVSFPNPNPGPTPAAKAYHVRSASLPCGRSHPLIPQVRGEVSALRAWACSDRVGSAHLVDGLTRLKGVLDSLDDVLQMPQTQDALSSQTHVVEKLLEDFLRFVDAYGIFQGSLLGLKQEVSSAQVAVRRKDDSKLGSYLKAQRSIVSEIGKLVSAVGSIPGGGDQILVPATGSSLSEDELGNVSLLVAAVSQAAFSWASGSSGPERRPGWARFGLGKRQVRGFKEEGGFEDVQKLTGRVESLLEMRKKGENCKKNKSKEMMEEVRMGVLKRMQELEDCIGEMEKGSEGVFRSLISTRVSLLNILTHA